MSEDVPILFEHIFGSHKEVKILSHLISHQELDYTAPEIAKICKITLVTETYEILQNMTKEKVLIYNPNKSTFSFYPGQNMKTKALYEYSRAVLNEILDSFDPKGSS